MIRNVLVACATVWSIAVPPVSAEPLVRIHTSYYYDAIVKKYRNLDQDYDRKTGHGRSEGAALL